MLPGMSMLNTIIGILLSLHKVVDVASITFNSFVMISLYVNSSNLTALGFVLGSESYTPSANFFAIKIASASISAARNAAVVSVEKYGLPRPAPKITIRFFSK